MLTKDVATLSRFGRRLKLSLLVERKLVQFVRNHQGTGRLEAAGTVTIVKPVLHQHGLGGCSPKRKPLLQK